MFELRTSSWLGSSSGGLAQQPTHVRSTLPARAQPGPSCSYDQDVLERQRRSPSSAPAIRSTPPPPPPPPPPPSKTGGDSRRNLLAALFAVVGVAGGYQLSQGGRQDSLSPQGAGSRRRAWVYADAKGTYNEETALRDNRRPILRVSGDTLEVLNSDDKFMRMHVSKRDPRMMIMEGNMGEFYTLSPAPGKVDVHNMKSLLAYFTDPRWEIGMRRSAVPAGN